MSASWPSLNFSHITALTGEVVELLEDMINFLLHFFSPCPLLTEGVVTCILKHCDPTLWYVLTSLQLKPQYAQVKWLSDFITASENPSLMLESGGLHLTICVTFQNNPTITSTFRSDWPGAWRCESRRALNFSLKCFFFLHTTICHFLCEQQSVTPWMSLSECVNSNPHYHSWHQD